MSDSGAKLALTRLAIIEHIERKKGGTRARAENPEQASGPDAAQVPPGSQAHARQYPGHGWGRRFAGVSDAGRAYWQQHPMRLAVELATPFLSSYARRRPVRFLGMAMAGGALLMLARPWKLISATGLLVAVLKSSQLSGLVMSAMSAANYPRDEEIPK